MIPINLQNKKAVSKREAEDLAIPQMFQGERNEDVVIFVM